MADKKSEMLSFFTFLKYFIVSKWRYPSFRMKSSKRCLNILLSYFFPVYIRMNSLLLT